MKKIIYPALAAMFCMSLSSCGIKIINEKDNVSKQLVITEKFDAIESYGTTDIEYVPGPAKLTLSAPREYLDEIRIYVENGTLIVTRKNADNINGNDHSKLTISYPDVSRFSTYGTGDFDISVISSNEIKLCSYGTGDFECKELKCGTLNVETAGTGDVEIDRAECTVAFLATEGTGDIDIKHITADTIDASTQGTGDITLAGQCRSARLESPGVGDIDSSKLKQGL